MLSFFRFFLKIKCDCLHMYYMYIPVYARVFILRLEFDAV